MIEPHSSKKNAAIDLSAVLDEFFNRITARPQHFRVGSFALSFSFLGLPQTSFLTRSLQHLEEMHGSPEAFHICFVDGSCGFPLPRSLLVWADVDGYSRAMNGLPDGFYGNINVIDEIIILIDFRQRRILYWKPAFVLIPESIWTLPLPRILSILSSTTAEVLVHAATVGTDKGGVMLPGISGTGKSTTALACLTHGMHYVGDDFTFVDTEHFLAQSIYNSAKLTTDNLQRFPELAQHVINRAAIAQDPSEKAWVFAHEFCPERVRAKIDIKAILLPRFTTQSETRIKLAGKADAFKFLVPSSTALVRADLGAVGKITKLVRQLPCYWVETGSEMRGIAEEITRFIEEDGFNSPAGDQRQQESQPS